MLTQDKAAQVLDFVRGDTTGLNIPAHVEALRTAGTDFLTQVFRAFGSLDPDNRVTRIARFEPCAGGSTGQKLLLSVEYENVDEALDTELFVKFSRDFTDPIRDLQRHEMQSEIRLGALSRHPAFPITVPTTYFGDFHGQTGTGLLITSRVRFGEGAIEPLRPKCMDHEAGDPLDYYRTVITAIARVVAAHKSGLLSPDVERTFPFDAQSALSEDRIPYDAAQLRARFAGFADLAAQAPQLFPASIIAPEFIASVTEEALRFLTHETAIKRFLHADPDYIALCHWNANIDNAWFWRDASGTLQCGLLDWGRVRQLNLAYAIWGCMLAAPQYIWENHLDELLTLFVDEIHSGGGPFLSAQELRLHLDLYVAVMGLATASVAPERILFRLPEAIHASGPLDPVFQKSSQARNFLQIYTNFLNLWQTHDFGASLDRMLERL